MAFDRHATSKIASVEDIYALHTFGFRGEALASIAAVAQVELRTRQEGDEVGTQTSVNGGKFQSQEPVMCPAGSQFYVRNLFYNVPARRRFLEKSTASSKQIKAETSTVSTGVYIVRRRMLIELIEKSMQEERYDFVKDILIRYKNVKKIYAYPMDSYWSNISSVDSYYNTNMDFLNKDIRDYFFRQYPDIYSKVEDLPPAKYNVGSNVKNSLVSSGCIINGTVENSILFKEVYIGNNCTIKNSIILNDVYIGDNTHIENCIVESRDTIRANTNYTSEDGKIRIVVEKNERYAL